MVQHRRGPLSPQFNRADFLAEVKAHYEKVWQEEDRLRAARQRQELRVFGPMEGAETTTSVPMSEEEEAYVNRELRFLMRRYGVTLDSPQLRSEIQKARGAFASIQAAKAYTWAGYCGPSCTPNTPLYREGGRLRRR
jgi:hypothetical protein